MAKRTKKLSKKSLKLEALEQRQLLAGIVGGGEEVLTDLTHPNGNVYDQVLMTGASVTVTADAGQVTRVSFLDEQGDIVQAEFAGSGTLTISLDNAKTNQDPTGYNQDVKYVQGLASFTIQGSDATTHFQVFSVGEGNAFTPGLFDETHKGGDHTADVARLTVVADPTSANGSLFGSIRAGNAIFSAESGVVGITATNVQVQQLVRIGDLDAKGSATPALVFGQNSGFITLDVAGGDLVQTNGKAINNTNSYEYGITAIDGEDSSGADLEAKTIKGVIFTGHDPLQQVTKTIPLTTSIDTLVGTSGDDTFEAAHTAGSAVVSTLDNINGGAGDDLLNISDAVGNAPVSGLTVANVEKLVYTSVAGIGGGALDTTGWTGLTNATLVLQKLAADQAFTAGAGTDVNITATHDAGGPWDLATTGGKAVTLTNNVGANTGGTVDVTGVEGTSNVSITQTKSGAGTIGAVSVTDWANGGDAGKTGTISSVTLNGATTATVTSNALTELSLTKVTGGVTVTDNLTAHAASAGRTTLAVALNESTTSITDTNSTIKQIDITATGKASTINVDGGGKNVLTTVSVAGDKEVTLSGVNGSNLATLTITNTAGVTATVGAGATVTGGAGADKITLGAATKKTIDLGAGNDWVQAPLTGDGKLDGGSLVGGEGTDTISLSFTDAKKASEATDLAGQISGFEKIELNGGTIGAGHEINFANLDGLKDIVIASDAGANYTLKALSSGASLTFTADQTATTTVDIPTAAIQNETLALNSQADNADLALNTINTGLVSAVNWTTDNTNSNPGTNTHSAALTSNSLRTITVSGDAGVDITNTGTGIVSVDGSGITKGGLAVTTGALSAAATITGSAQGDAITATNATAAVTVNSGGGNDTVTIANAKANVIDTGAGNDTVTVGSGNNTITTGAGNDTINLNTAGDVGSNTVDAGDGNDTINVGKSVGQTTITLGGGNDTVAFTGIPDTGGYFVTIAGAGNGDVVDFSAVDNDVANDEGGDATSFNTAKIELGQGVSFSDYLNEAAKSTTANANSVIRWFEFGGDTFLVLDNSSDATFDAGSDLVVRLSGSINLGATGTAASELNGVITI